MKKGIFTLFLLMVSAVSFSQGTFVFLGSFNRDKTSENLVVYQLDTLTGFLSKVSGCSNLSNPSYQTLSPNGKFLYACTESKTASAGSVTAFEFNPLTKELSCINTQKSGGENPVYLMVHKNGRWLINGNYTESSISVYPLLENGSIGPLAQKMEFVDSSVVAGRQDQSHIHSTVFSPDGESVFACDLGADKILAFQFDENKTQPMKNAEPDFIKTQDGAGPRHLVFHPNGQFAYCIEELSGSISVFSANDVELTTIQQISNHSDSITEGFESSDIQLSPDGLFLYASNRGQENNLGIFSVGSDGKLTPIGYQSTLGNHPRIFAIDPSGKFLIVTNVVSGNVVVFKRNSQTGRLTPIDQDVRMSNVSCVRIQRY